MLRSLPAKHSRLEVGAHRHNVHTQVLLRPNLSSPFPSLAAWVSPQAKTYHVLHGIIVVFCAHSCARACLVSTKTFVAVGGQLCS